MPEEAGIRPHEYLARNQHARRVAANTARRRLCATATIFSSEVWLSAATKRNKLVHILQRSGRATGYIARVGEENIHVLWHPGVKYHLCRQLIGNMLQAPRMFMAR